MNLFKLLLLGAAIWIIWRLLRGLRVQVTRLEPPPKPEQFESMARCNLCDVHLPASALSASGLCGKCSSNG